MRLSGIITLIALLSSCMGGGTHGSIKSYNYNVSKYVLEKVVHNVIADNNAIRQDSIKDYFSDDTGYITIHVTENGLPYKYIFRFYRGKEYWDTSKTSALFIAYAYNAKHEGGSEGGKIEQHGARFIHDLIQPFGREFILKIDSTLNMKHTEE